MPKDRGSRAGQIVAKSTIPSCYLITRYPIRPVSVQLAFVAERLSVLFSEHDAHGLCPGISTASRF